MIVRYYQSTPLDAQVVGALWRIGDKYMIEDLREEAMSRIRKTYASTRDDWDKFHRNKNEPTSNGIESNVGLSDLCNLALIARQGRIDKALPAIYLACAYYSYNTLQKALYPDLPGSLPNDVVRGVIGGKERLSWRHREMVFSWLSKEYAHPPGCKQPNACRLARLVVAQDHFMADVDIHEFGQAKWQNKFTKDFCNVCKADARRAYNEGSSKYWNFVPQAFLGSWSMYE
jgi:hypothetical protein